MSGLPAIAYPAQIVVAGRASRSALVSFEANEYSVAPVQAGRMVTVLARVGEPLLQLVSTAGELVAEHRRAPRGAGQTIRTAEHARQLETAVLAAFTTEQACRRKPNLPPGPDALAELARLRGLPAEQTAVAISDPADRGYDEHRARTALQALVGSILLEIRIITLDPLLTSDDGRDVQADLAIDLSLAQNGDTTVALFHWGVNDGVEQLCVWNRPLKEVWPHHATSPVFGLQPSWEGWPTGALKVVEGFKLRESEVGLNRADLRFAQGGLGIMTGGLSGDEVDSLLLSPLG